VSEESVGQGVLGADPLEDGMDAPEGYSRDVRLGGAREWETTPPTIDHRLPQEQPDAQVEQPPDRPLDATPLDESIDDPENAVGAAEEQALRVEQEH
jgi:hypothetical protein